MNEHGFSMRVQTDPAMALTIRVFVAEAARQLGLHDAQIEDLRLLATELLGNAVETGSPTLELTLGAASGAWRLEARGAGSLDAPADVLIDRRAVLNGLARLTSAEGTIWLSPREGD